MKVELRYDNCLVWQTPNDPKYYNESRLWYHIKQALIEQGHDVIKKCPAKDGHLTDAPYYIRARDWGWALVDDCHMTRDLADTFNRNGEITLVRLPL